MNVPLTYKKTLVVGLASRQHMSCGLSRVFSAAVVDKQFCDLLLKNPEVALSKGYLGEIFSLSREEWDLIISIRAASLPDLARQVNRSLNNI